MKQNICLFIKSDGMTCNLPEKLDLKCPGRCGMFVEDLADLFVPEKAVMEKTEGG